MTRRIFPAAAMLLPAIAQAAEATATHDHFWLWFALISVSLLILALLGIGFFLATLPEPKAPGVGDYASWEERHPRRQSLLSGIQARLAATARTR